MKYPQNGIEDPTRGTPSGKDGAPGFVSDRERVLSYPQAVSKDNSEARPARTFYSLFAGFSRPASLETHNVPARRLS